MQAAIISPSRHHASPGLVQRYVLARFSWVNLVRVCLAAMAVIAIPLDVERRAISPAPNWPLIVIEPALLIAYLRCTLGSLR